MALFHLSADRPHMTVSGGRFPLVLFLLTLTAVLCGCADFPKPSPTETISQLNQRMEALFCNGQLQELARVYRDDGHLLGPNDHHVEGRQAIDAYWAAIPDPQSWELNLLELESNEAAVFQSTTWKQFANKPAHWRTVGIEVPDQADALFQLGRSTLCYKLDQEVHTSVVNFILVRIKDDSGTYRIFVDSYAPAIT